MKKILIALFVLPFAALAQTGTSEIPETVKKAFSVEHPTASKVEWKKEDDGTFEAEYKANGKEMESKYAADGKWVSTETALASVAELPAAVRETLQKEFPGFKIEDPEMVSMPGNVTQYEVEATKKHKEWEVVLDASGKVVKKELEKSEKGDKKEKAEKKG